MLGYVNKTLRFVITTSVTSPKLTKLPITGCEMGFFELLCYNTSCFKKMLNTSRNLRASEPPLVFMPAWLK